MDTKFRTILLILAGIFFILPAGAQDTDWLPEATGMYSIGTSSYHWIDENREELFTDDPDDRREVMVRIWYPAELENGVAPLAYFAEGDTDIAGFLDSQADAPFVDDISVDILANTMTESYPDVPVLDTGTSYPVLIYSPGSPGMPEFATAHIQELVSHGYIVVAINHPYFSGWTVFPDGRMVVSNLFDRVMADPGQMAVSIEIGAEDQVFVLNQLALLNESDDPVSGYLDMENIATFGTSWGAWVVAEASVRDSRFDALLVEGPHQSVPPVIVNEGLAIPVMFMNPTGERTTFAYNRLPGPAYHLVMDGLNGWNYGDFALWTGFPEREQATATPERAMAIVNAYALAFFDQYLKGEEQALLQGLSSNYPEVTIESRNTDQ